MIANDDRPSVLFCSPGMAMGGAEQWIVTLSKYLRRLRPLGVFVTSQIYDPILIRQANAIDLPFLSDAHVDCDVVVTWGVRNVRKYLGPTKVPIVEVAHSCPTHQATTSHLEQAAAIATHLVAVSPVAKKAYPPEWQPAVTVIENGVDGERLRSNNGCARDTQWPTVVQLGRLSPEKRPQKLIEASAYLPSHWTMLVVGDGPLLQECIDLAKRVAKCRVVFVPPTEDVASVYRSADVLCVTSETEGLPSVVLESWAMKVPVVSTAYETASYLCDRWGKSVMDLVPLDVAPRKLAKAIRKAAKKDSRKAHHVAVRYYSARHMAERWEHYLLDEVLEAP